ncbi:uncharacterized protein [Choristoneura fumiferana]|uniref:uncharacterized protein n=1 Tax=Choristoneura fumiferana TaxID=7141 RepID=UPI003D154ED2
MFELPLLIPLILTTILLTIIGVCICCQCLSNNLPRSNVAEAPSSMELESTASSYDDSILHEPIFNLPKFFHPEPPPSYEEAMKISSNVRHRNSKEILNVENATFERRPEVGSSDVGGETTTDSV